MRRVGEICGEHMRSTRQARLGWSSPGASMDGGWMDGWADGSNGSWQWIWPAGRPAWTVDCGLAGDRDPQKDWTDACAATTH